MAGSRAFGAYQYLMDVSVFFLGGSMLTSEKDFTDFRAAVRFAPSEANALSFERAKFESQRWLLRQALEEGLQMVAVVLEEVRTLCSMAKHLGKDEEGLQAAMKEVTGAERLAFRRMSIPARLEQLKERYGLEPSQAAGVLSLLAVANCLQSHNGVVTKTEGGESGHLEIRLNGFQVREREGQAAKDGQKEMVVQMTEAVKRVAVGQPIELNRFEHMGAILCICLFTSSLLQAADRFLSGLDGDSAGEGSPDAKAAKK